MKKYDNMIVEIMGSFIDSFPKNELTESIKDAINIIFESEEDRKSFTRELFNEIKESYVNHLEGGLGDKTMPDDVDDEQLFKGVKVEFEHAHDPMIAMEIALDHLTEIPDYYDWLKEMEDSAKDSEIDALHEAVEEVPLTNRDYKLKLWEWLNSPTSANRLYLNKSELSIAEMNRFNNVFQKLVNETELPTGTVELFNEYNINLPEPQWEVIKQSETNIPVVSEVPVEEQFKTKYSPELAKINDVKSEHRGAIPKFKGINEEKIRKHLKSSAGVSQFTDSTMRQEIQKFDSIDDLRNHIYYHGSGTSMKGLRAGASLPKNAFRGGGYAELQHSISLSKDKNLASEFTGDRTSGTVYPVLLKKNARVLNMEGKVGDAVELEDYMSYLWEHDIDAVWIGGGEKELVVLNPRVLVQGEGNSFSVFNKAKFTNDDVEEFAKKYGKTFNNSLNESIEGLQYFTVSDSEVYSDDYEPLDNSNDLLSQAERLVSDNGLRMLRDDNIFEIAVTGDKVIGVLYYSFGTDIRWSIAVSPDARNQGIAKKLFSDVSSIPEYDYAENVIAELVSPYYLESLVSSNGYEKTGEEHGFRIYTKALNTSNEEDLMESTGWYPKQEYPKHDKSEMSHRDKLIFSILSMYKAMNEMHKKQFRNKVKGVSKWELEQYPDEYLMRIKMDASDMRDAEKDMLNSNKLPKSHKLSAKDARAYDEWKANQTKDAYDDYEEYRRIAIDRGEIDEDGNKLYY